VYFQILWTFKRKVVTVRAHGSNPAIDNVFSLLVEKI